jgi:hypothetical protein
MNLLSAVCRPTGHKITKCTDRHRCTYCGVVERSADIELNILGGIPLHHARQITIGVYQRFRHLSETTASFINYDKLTKAGTRS